MKVKIRLATALFLLVALSASSQNLVWTGSASNNDFFDENNWKDSVTNIVPASGSINADTAINRAMQISTASATITANGNINLGTGSLSLTNATLVAVSVGGAGGSVAINEDGYFELTDTTPIKNTNPRLQINFTSGLGWIKTTNFSARFVSVTHIGQIKVNGNAAVYRTNLRLDNYYHTGCIIRSNVLTTAPLTVYDGQNLQGNTALITVDAIHSGGAIAGGMNNKIQSFVLKKGFMVTIANADDGTGKGKNYIASEADLRVQILPKLLQKSISFIRVMPWNWVTKKGFNAPVDDNLNASWRYQWSHNESSPVNYEFAPMSWGQGTAADSWIPQHLALYNTTHMMSFNEPDDCDAQSGQWGTPKLCVIDEAVKWHKNLAKTGMRLVSPGGREEAPFGWLEDFYKKAIAEDARIDVIAVHWYDWGSNPRVGDNATGDAAFNRFKIYLKKVHDLYGLPIWITEFNANPARSQAVNARFLELALPYLESLDYIERYCWFPFNTGTHFTTGWNETTRKPTNTIPSLVGTIYKNINNAVPTASTPSIPEATVDAANSLDLIQYPNIALNKPATANSASSATAGAEKAVDGDSATTASRWVVNFGDTAAQNRTPLPAWIEVDLQGTFTLDSFKIVESTSTVKDFNFQYWDASLNSGAGGWNNAVTVTGNPTTSLTTSRSFDAVTTTKIRLFVTAHNHASYLRVFELEVYGYASTSLGVSIYEKQEFSIYPNPVKNGILNISSEKEVTSVAVYNLLGAKIDVPFENNQIQVFNLTPGIYFLKINNKYSYKFIKN